MDRVGTGRRGYTAVAISYRLAPAATFPAQLYDCQAAVRWMRSHASEYKIDPEHIGGFGYSAGGHLVAASSALDDNQLKEDGVAADAPSARLQVVLAGGAPCDFRDLPLSSGILSYWLAGHAPKNRITIATHRRPTSSRPTIRPCTSSTAWTTCSSPSQPRENG
ncbi:MAG: alpha/beta hydrolase [Minicystis sp.]